jgi:hypothetical protein
LVLLLLLLLPLLLLPLLLSCNFFETNVIIAQVYSLHFGIGDYVAARRSRRQNRYRHTSHLTRRKLPVTQNTSPGLFCVRYSLDRNGGFVVDWTEAAHEGGGRNCRRAKIVTVKRGYCWAILSNTEEMDAQRPDVFPNIAQMVFAMRLQLRIIAKLPEQNAEDALSDLRDKGLM